MCYDFFISPRRVFHSLCAIPLHLRHPSVSPGDISRPVHQTRKYNLLEENLSPFWRYASDIIMCMKSNMDIYINYVPLEYIGKAILRHWGATLNLCKAFPSMALHTWNKLSTSVMRIKLSSNKRQYTTIM